MSNEYDMGEGLHHKANFVKKLENVVEAKRHKMLIDTLNQVLDDLTKIKKHLGVL